MSSVGSVRKVPPPPPDAQVQVVGAEVGGYVLGELLTQGGMASVYLGKRVAPGGFEKAVVFKRLRPELASQPALLGLFLREASLSAGLEHPCIVRTFDLAKLDGSYYLVMEYVRGGDLRLLLRRARRRGQRFSAAAALRIGRELLTALEYAHSRCTADGWPLGLSHRDVSPANILISAEGEVKLSDFGIAQASTEEGLGDFAGVRLRGKVGYMSPEQACGAAVDSRSDLFSLAAVLYEVLTGKRLFIGQPGQPLTEIYQTAIVPPSQLCPELPGAADAVLARALCARPEGRYQSAREFYDALLALTRQHNLWLDHVGFAEQLRELCGPDASSWRVLEERTSTAIIASLGDADDDGDDSSGAEFSREYDASGELTGTAVLPAWRKSDADSGGHRHGEHGERLKTDSAGVRSADARGAGAPGALVPTGETLSDHVTVPWPTVLAKELMLPPGASPDDTMPLPAALLAMVDDPLSRNLAPNPAPGADPAASSGSAIPPLRASASGSAIALVPASAADATTLPVRPSAAGSAIGPVQPSAADSATLPVRPSAAGSAIAPVHPSAAGSALPPLRSLASGSASPATQPSAPGAASPRAAAHSATRIIEHALPPGADIDLDAVTSPAELVDTTAPLAKATLPAPAELTESIVPPVLRTAQVAVPPSAATTSPMHPLTLGARLRERGRELLGRVGGWSGLTLLFVLACGLIFSLWLTAGAQLWSWLWTHLQPQ